MKTEIEHLKELAKKAGLKIKCESKISTWKTETFFIVFHNNIEIFQCKNIKQAESFLLGYKFRAEQNHYRVFYRGYQKYVKDIICIDFCTYAPSYEEAVQNCIKATKNFFDGVEILTQQQYNKHHSHRAEKMMGKDRNMKCEICGCDSFGTLCRSCESSSGIKVKYDGFDDRFVYYNGKHVYTKGTFTNWIAKGFKNKIIDFFS
jgi:hypothetical protein